MVTPVYITGIGIISAIGRSASEVFKSLRGGRSGIGEITLFDTIHKGSLPVAEVKATTRQLLEMAGFLERKDFTRTALLGIIAAREAMASANLDEQFRMSAGLVSATTVGGMDRSEDFYRRYLENPGRGKLADIIGHDCGESAERIALACGITGFATTISTACSSSANSVMLAARLIASGRFDCMIAGGTDAVTQFTLNGFNTLMILDKTGCRPFDEHRAGLTLGEAAAFLVLESENSILRRGIRPLAILAGYANANDAYHQTASSPDGMGAYLAMTKALESAALDPAMIGYINVHGTGTENNDLSEGTAIQRIYGSNVPPFSSTKPFTGHTLGAAGAVEAVISVLSLQHGMIFPNLNWETPMKELSLKPETALRTGIGIRHVLSNSFGFGGNNSTLIFSKS
jgi:3-oxoacyl-[acyl-carrier-protein] synthase-1